MIMYFIDPKDFVLDLFRQGKLFHTAVDDILTLREASEEDTEAVKISETPPEVDGYMESIREVLEDVSRVRAVESTVQHGTLNYLGIVDCVAYYR